MARLEVLAPASWALRMDVYAACEASWAVTRACEASCAVEACKGLAKHVKNSRVKNRRYMRLKESLDAPRLGLGDLLIGFVRFAVSRRLEE